MKLPQQRSRNPTFCRRRTKKIKEKLRVTVRVKHLARVQLRRWKKNVCVCERERNVCVSKSECS